MNWAWRRTTKHVWTLDARWQVVEETPGQWRAYRDGKPMLADFPTVQDCMKEAESLRKQDKLYAPKEESQ